MKIVTILILSITILNGCSSVTKNSIIKKFDRSRAPSKLEMMQIPNATPKVEPRCKYGNMNSYEVFGVTYRPLRSATNFTERGIASWYGPNFNGKNTSCMEIYDMYAMSAAHKTLPLPSYVEVTNLDNQKKIIVRVNDRGPFHKGRIIDLSYTAAHKLGVVKKGTAPVSIRVIDPSNLGTPVVNRLSERDNSEIQLGLFSKFSNANSLQLKLEKLTNVPIEIRTIQKSQTAGKNSYQVFIRPASTNFSTTTIIKQLKKMGIRTIIKD